MRQKHDNLKKTTTEAHGKAVKAIKDAVYGAGHIEAADNFAYTKSEKCGSTGKAGTAGMAMVEDLICLCTKGSGSKTTECYTPGPAEINNNKVDGVRDIVNDMTANCPKMSADVHKTPALIAQRIAAFYAELGRQPAGQSTATGVTQYVLGKYSVSGCTVAATQQCVNYAGALGKGKTGIRWEKMLRSAEQHLLTGSHAAAELSSMTHRLQAAVQQAETARRAAAIEQEAEIAARAEAVQSNKKHGDQKKLAIDATTKTCNEKTDADTCRKYKKCQCDKTKKEGPKCVLSEEGKKEEEQSNQETGGKYGKTDSTCTGKPQGECKLPDCKWDSKICKYSSSPVNKKLALIAAYFISFIAFLILQNFKGLCFILCHLIKLINLLNYTNI
uniref:Variant surface glycoprotein 1125.2676 n=1 Tax=Trypanosoma brucei TaxID=5691 RepID=A0A1J0R8S8_9TRYP|nr:variant surface glycoprotein 1125.2676 [Trypanosoma brucei]